MADEARSCYQCEGKGYIHNPALGKNGMSQECHVCDGTGCDDWCDHCELTKADACPAHTPAARGDGLSAPGGGHDE